jgi:uncharacterized damage-inducible protein DinB
MIFQAGIENNNEGRSVAWALEHPGCYAYGINAGGAILNLESALSKYAGWILHHDVRTWLSFSDNDIEFDVNGVWDVYAINDDLDKVGEADGYAVNAFFPYDWKPLNGIEIKHAVRLLSWTREDLLKTIQGVSQEEMDATYAGERWSITGILGHISGAEWWYMDRLGLALPKNELPEEPLARLKKVREHFLGVLPGLSGVKKVVGLEGEFWSPRKLLRRVLWHERDHTEHITKLL